MGVVMFDPHSDDQQRCPACGRFMAIRETRYEAGDADVWHECTGAKCQAIEAERVNAYYEMMTAALSTEPSEPESGSE
jgi:hypothetical protein